MDGAFEILLQILSGSDPKHQLAGIKVLKRVVEHRESMMLEQIADADFPLPIALYIQQSAYTRMAFFLTKSSIAQGKQ